MMFFDTHIEIKLVHRGENISMAVIGMDINNPDNLIDNATIVLNRFYKEIRGAIDKDILSIIENIEHNKALYVKHNDITENNCYICNVTKNGRLNIRFKGKSYCLCEKCVNYSEKKFEESCFIKEGEE